jgi:putative FmdB family regulatory protein
MPIFEFVCPSCGHQFEELILGESRMSEMRCPKCAKQGVEKLLSVFSSARGTIGSSASSGAGCGPSPSRFS